LRIGVMFLVLLPPVSGFAESPNQLNKRWFVDLGGKTAEIVGQDKSLTGVRAGVRLANNINVGAEAYTLTRQVTSQNSGNYRQQNSYNFFGPHIEYSYKIYNRLLLIPGVSAGFGMGTYEEKDGDVYSSVETVYTSVEPSIVLSVRVIRSMWLNAGGSYLLIGDQAGFKNGPSLNIFARYVW